MNDAGILIPILVPLGAFAMIFGIYYLKTRENLAMLEKGINPKENANRPASYSSLKNGLLFLGAGLGSLVAYFIDSANVGSNFHHRAIYFSLIAIGGGLGLITSYAIEKKERLNRRNDIQS
ncbi:MAG: hypothetical protein C4329_07810 [Chitinophagaceae bacterium]